MKTERAELNVSVSQKPAITVRLEPHAKPEITARLEPCAKPFVPPDGTIVEVPSLADLIFNYKLGAT
ncbi:TPA: hypothetical protein WI395_000661 [Neisseria meningitidis]